MADLNHIAVLDEENFEDYIESDIERPIDIKKVEMKDGKVYVVESNAQPGVPFDSTVEIYKSIFEDFYKNPVNKESNNQLNDYAKEMVKMTLKKDNKRFSDKS